MAHHNLAEFESRLTHGADRFIAHLLEHAFAIGRRTGEDFLRHFPPTAIMDALKELPALRADILEAATGVRRKIALKKSANSAGEDLQIALEEGEAAIGDVVGLFRPDDRVRYLPRRSLWAFLIEGEFWKVNKTDKVNYDRAQQHIAFMLDRGLKDDLLTHQDVIEGISVNKIAQLMPRAELEMALDKALSASRSGQPFTDRDLYEHLTAMTLTTHIPLPHIWEQVIYPCIALDHDLADPGHPPGLTPATFAEEPHLSPAAEDESVALEHQAAPQTSPTPLTAYRPPGLRSQKTTVTLRRPQLQAPPARGTARPDPHEPAAPQTPAPEGEPATLQEDVAFDLDFDEESTLATKGQ